MPRAKRLPLVGALPYHFRDPLGFCTKTALAGEGVAGLDVRPVKLYVVSHTDYIHQILVTGAANYQRGSILDRIRVSLGNGLPLSDGALWKRQRRLMQPVFHHRQVERMAGTVVEEIAGQIADSTCASASPSRWRRRSSWWRCWPQRFDVELPAGAVVRGRYVMTYQPKNGLPPLLHPRGRAA